jgi:hypothetical protein
MKVNLNKLISGTTFDEVSLFRAMLKCFQQNHKATLIEETH